MLTLPTNFRVGLERGGIIPTFRVHIGAVKGDAGHIATMLAAPELYDDDPPIVVNLSALQTSIDLFQGAMASGDATVRVGAATKQGAFVRELVSGSRLLGKDLILEWGFPEAITGWSDSDFVNIFRGTIREISMDADSVVSIGATTADQFREYPPGRVVDFNSSRPSRSPMSPWSYSGGTTSHSYSDINETYISSNAHPLDLCLDLLRQANFPSRFIDSTSFNHTSAANESIDHLKVACFANTAADSRVNQESETRSLVEHLAFFMGGFITITEAGELSFNLFDPSGSSNGTFDRSTQILPGSFQSKQSIDNMIGRVVVETAHASTGGDDNREPRARFTLEDRGFQANWGRSTSSTERTPYSFDLRDRFFGAVGSVIDEISVSGVTEISVREPMIFDSTPSNISSAQFRGNERGFCGSLATGDEADSDHLVYLMLTDMGGSGRVEIISAEGSGGVAGNFFASNFTTLAHLHGDNIISGSGAPYPSMSVMCVDITVPYRHAKNLLTWYAGPVDKVKLSTNMLPGPDGLNPFEVQVGDIIDLDHSEYLSYGIDGTPTGEKFIVTSKSFTPYPPRIDWELQRLRSSAPTLTVPEIDHIPAYHNPAIAIPNDPASRSRASGAAFVNDGEKWGLEPIIASGGLHGATSGTLDATIPALDGYAGGSRISGEDEDVEYSGSVDSYVFLVYGVGFANYNVMIEEVANKAAPPTGPSGITASSFPLMRCRADASEITNVVDLRPAGLAAAKTMAPSENVKEWRRAGRHNVVTSKLTTANASGLSHDLTGVSCLIKGELYERTLDQAHTYTASKATFVYLTLNGSLAKQGAFAFAEATIGDGEPSTYADDPKYCLVGVVETDGSSIVEVRNWVPNALAATLSPSLIGTALPPNGSFDALDSSGFPLGWEKSQTGTGTVGVVSGDTKSKHGRVGLEFTIAAGSDEAEILSETFPVAALLNWDAWLIYYSSTGAALTAGLRVLDADLAVIATREGLASSENVSAATSDQGAVKEATWTGVGATATTLPALARFARFYIKVEENTGLSTPQDLTVSLAALSIAHS